ncbi:RsfA family transcriptional regulator [Sporolactobacillus sp. THM7-7]|nr:RsfA family transcriptional regulator [Sporolactobacillus sp. THM7-7]
MPSIRQDAWSHGEDVRLAETVLRHIRAGSTQLAAFAEAGGLLSRTPAACGFRWNSSVRKRYETEMTEAKEERREARKRRKKVSAFQENANESDSVLIAEFPSDQTIDQMIRFLNRIKKDARVPFSLDIKHQLDRLREDYQALEKDYRKLEKDYAGMKSNYDALLKILRIVDQARQRIPESGTQKTEQDRVLEAKES